MNVNKRIYRFAPSPTGKMHIGNGRTALLNFFSALKYKGDFFLRIDDTDQERDREDYEQSIYEDLKWLGIKYNLIIKQSDREDIYEEYFQKLIKTKRVYECFEEEDELVENSIYDRRSLYLTEEEKNKLRETKTPYWRFLLKNTKIEVNDGILGKMTLNKNWSDPIIKRPRVFKPFTYNFTSAVDDFLMGVTHIIRAQEHFYNATIQQDIISALSGQIINFAHLPLIINRDGNKLSKRKGALSISTLREEGYHPFSIISLCLSLGSNKAPLISTNQDDYVQYLDLNNFSKSSPQFEKKELTDLNRKILRILNDEEVKHLGFDLNIWNIIKYNISLLTEYDQWNEILNKQDLHIPYDDHVTLHKIYKNGLLDLTSLSSEEKKSFFTKLRLSLTGLSIGPELDKILLYKLQFPLIKQKLQI